MPNSSEIADGLDILREVLDLKSIATLIERTARWVAPETFRFLPLWFPEHARGELFYKRNWSEEQRNKNRKRGTSIHKFEGNVHANEALTLALGMKKKSRPNWSCCHIWGVDDVSFQRSNEVVSDRRFFSCVGNMVLLPTPLKAFTDSMPEVKTMLRICARNLYDWECEHECLKGLSGTLDRWSDWSSFPESWPRQRGERLPLGTVPFNSTIQSAAEKRKDAIRRDLNEAGPFYPREAVKAALAHWKIEL